MSAVPPPPHAATSGAGRAGTAHAPRYRSRQRRADVEAHSPQGTVTLVALTAGATTLAGATVVAVSAADLAVQAVGWSILSLSLLVLGKLRFGAVMTSPVLIVASGLVGLALVGRALYDTVVDARGAAAVDLRLSQVNQVRTMILLMAAATAILTGALLWSTLIRAITGPTRPNGERGFMAVQLDERFVRAMPSLGPVPLLLLVVSYGPSRMLERSVYIEEHVQGSLLTAGASILSVLMIAPFGYLVAINRYRALMLLYGVTYAIAFFSLGTRRFALLPILFAVGFVAAKPGKRSLLVLAPAVLLALYLVELPLTLRFLPSHGLIPYIEALPEVLQQDYPWTRTAKNLLFPFALIGATAFGVARLPNQDHIVSLNPMPGSIAGWYEIAPRHRFNLYSPMAGLGEIGNAGIVAAMSLCLVIGVVLCHLDRRVSQLLIAQRTLPALALLLLSGLFLLLFVNYNLRSASRLLYYALLVDLGTRLIGRGARPPSFARRRRARKS